MRKTTIDRLAAGVLAALVWTGCGRGAAEAPRTFAAARGPVRMALPFRGELEARRVETIAVGVQGSAVLAELVPEGTRVEAGDLLARFDALALEPMPSSPEQMREFWVAEKRRWGQIIKTAGIKLD